MHFILRIFFRKKRLEEILLKGEEAVKGSRSKNILEISRYLNILLEEVFFEETGSNFKKKL